MKNKKGVIFWVTGLSGSGKSTIAKLLHKKISKLYGKTLIIHAEDLINTFDLKSFKKKDRIKRGIFYSKFLTLLSNKNINVIFTVIGMFYKVRISNRNNIKNYREIYIETNLAKILKKSKKTHYVKKSKNIIGIDIKPEFPKKPHVKIHNNFKNSPNFYANEILLKLKKLDFS